jgi:hypothetical protein
MYRVISWFLARYYQHIVTYHLPGDDVYRDSICPARQEPFADGNPVVTEARMG